MLCILLVGWQVVEANTEITLEKIMSHSDWLGNVPEGAYWSGNKQYVYYWQKQQGSENKKLIEFSLQDNQAKEVPVSEWKQKAQHTAIYDNSRYLKAKLYDGNIVVENFKTGKSRQFTDDNEKRKQLSFLLDGRLSFRLGNSIQALNLKSGLVSTIIDVKMMDNPHSNLQETNFLHKQQNRLFDYIRLQKQIKEEQAEFRRKKIKAKGGFGAVTWYLGKNNLLTQLSLSPNGRWAIAVTKTQTKTQQDIMPKFVTDTGYVNQVKLRPKVGAVKSAEEKLWLLDIRTNEKFILDVSVLPDFNSDRLKVLREKNAPEKLFKRYVVLFDWLIENPIKWSHDGASVAFTLTSFDNKDRWIVGIDFNKKELITYEHYYDEAWINDYAFNEFGWVNNDTLYYLSEKSGYGHLYLHRQSKTQQITQGNYEVSNVKLSTNGKFFYFIANKEHPGVYEVYRVGIDNRKIKRLTTAGGKNEFILSPDESTLLLLNSQLTRPSELFLQDIETPQTRRQISFTLSDAFSSIAWNKPSIVAIDSKHTKLPIYGRLYKPRGKDLKKAVMFVHGAGYLQNVHFGWSPYFREFMFHSLLTQKGYTVLDLDYRASRGYGRDWRTAIYRQMGTPELEDYIVGAKWLVEKHGINPDKIGIYGGSYGGFMTFMALFKSPDTFAAGAALRPVTDWAHFNQGYTSNILNTPDIDPEAYLNSSPIEFAQGLKSPLLICHGMVDDNVVFQDSVRLVQRLIELEKDNFELAVYPVEGHSFKQASSWLDEYKRILKLFEEEL